MLFSLSYFTLFAALASALPADPISNFQQRNVSLNGNGYYNHLDPKNFTLGAVRASPVRNATSGTFNISATVDLGVEIIKNAASNGVSLLALGEIWYPGYPFVDGNTWPLNFIENSMTVGDENWEKLRQAAANTGIYVGFGFSERAGDYIYLAQALFSPEGELLIHRHKLRPSGGERNLWSDGKLDQLIVIDTPYGRMGMLECWEHFHPTTTFPMQAQQEDIHIGSWPTLPDFGKDETPTNIWDSGELNSAAAQFYARNSGAVTVMAVENLGQVIDQYEIVVTTSNSTTPNTTTYVTWSVDTTTFRNTPYDVNGQMGYGALEEMLKSYPSYIPKVTGSYILPKNNSIEEIEALVAANITFFSGNPDFTYTQPNLVSTCAH